MSGLRELWKPLLLLVIAVILVGAGLRVDPAQPRCGATRMTPQMVCAAEGRGGSEQRTYAQMSAEARAWQLGLPLAGGFLTVAAAGWTIGLVRRRNAPPVPVSPWAIDAVPVSPTTPVRHR